MIYEIAGDRGEPIIRDSDVVDFFNGKAARDDELDCDCTGCDAFTDFLGLYFWVD